MESESPEVLGESGKAVLSDDRLSRLGVPALGRLCCSRATRE